MRPRTVIIGGVRFVSTNPGEYRSLNGAYEISHQLAGSVNSQWEVYPTDAHGQRIIDPLDWGPTLGDLRDHAHKGLFALHDAPSPRRSIKPAGSPSAPRAR